MPKDESSGILATLAPELGISTARMGSPPAWGPSKGRREGLEAKSSRREKWEEVLASALLQEAAWPALVTADRSKSVQAGQTPEQPVSLSTRENGVTALAIPGDGGGTPQPAATRGQEPGLRGEMVLKENPQQPFRVDQAIAQVLWPASVATPMTAEGGRGMTAGAPLAPASASTVGSDEEPIRAGFDGAGRAAGLQPSRGPTKTLAILAASRELAKPPAAMVGAQSDPQWPGDSLGSGGGQLPGMAGKAASWPFTAGLTEAAGYVQAEPDIASGFRGGAAAGEMAFELEATTQVPGARQTGVVLEGRAAAGAVQGEKGQAETFPSPARSPAGEVSLEGKPGDEMTAAQNQNGVHRIDLLSSRGVFWVSGGARGENMGKAQESSPSLSVPAGVSVPWPGAEVEAATATGVAPAGTAGPGVLSPWPEGAGYLSSAVSVSAPAGEGSLGQEAIPASGQPGTGAQLTEPGAQATEPGARVANAEPAEVTAHPAGSKKMGSRPEGEGKNALGSLLGTRAAPLDEAISPAREPGGTPADGSHQVDEARSQWLVGEKAVPVAENGSKERTPASPAALSLSSPPRKERVGFPTHKTENGSVPGNSGPPASAGEVSGNLGHGPGTESGLGGHPWPQGMNFADPSREVLERPAFVEHRPPAVFQGATPRAAEIKLVLEPDHFGRLAVRVALTGEEVTARLQVVDPLVKATLESGLSQLRATLEQQGIRLGEFNVTLSQHGFQGQEQEQWRGFKPAFPANLVADSPEEREGKKRATRVASGLLDYLV